MTRTAGLLLLTALALAAPARADGPKNVLLIIADDLGNDPGCYGGRAKTPNIDRLAAEGVRFTHGFAAVSSCSPSRAVLFTGQYNHTNGQYGLAHAEHHFATHDKVKSVSALLKAKGYFTGILAKEHVLPRSVYPYDRIHPAGGGRDVAAVAAQARAFFAEAGAKPFYLVVGFTDPHRAGQGFANDRDYPGVPRTAYRPEDVAVPFFLPDRPEVRADLADYLQSVSRLDHGVGMVLEALRAADKAKDTLVIFLSDNGIPFPGAKTTVYDPGVQLPLIVSTPTLAKRGIVNRAMVSWVDIAPTMLDWAGVAAPEAMAGRSLLPILGAEEPNGWDKVYLSHTFHEVTMYYPMRAVRTRQYKFIWNLAHELPFPPAADLYHSATWQAVLAQKLDRLGDRPLNDYTYRPKEELYDLAKDPGELKNVAEDPAYAAVLKELREDLWAFMKRTKDPWAVRQEY